MHATSLTTSSFGLAPSPLSADVIYGCPLTALAWVLDVSTVAADGRRTLRVEKQATHSKAGNEHPNLGSTLACVC